MEAKRELYIWKHENELDLLKEVLVEQPHRHVTGSKERGAVWERIAKNLNKTQGLKVTKRSVRKRFDKLYTQFQEREKKEKRDSGIEVEYDEKHRVLTDYHELIVGWESERQEKSDDEKVMAGEMRKQATKRLSTTKRRKEKENAEEGEPGPLKRKSHKTLVDITEQSISARKEEKNREFEIRANELKQQEHFHNLLLQQQQHFQQQ